MDVNLTGHFAANLIQNPIMIMGAGAIGGLVTGGLTLLGIWIANNNMKDRDEQNRKAEARKRLQDERKRTYVQLFSRRKLVQLYLSMFESKIYSTRHYEISKILLNQMKPQVKEALCKATTESETIRLSDEREHIEREINIQLDERKYWIHNGNEIKKEVFLEDKLLFEILGSISTSFPETDKLKELIKQISDFRTLIPPKPPTGNLTFDQIDKWEDAAIASLDPEVRKVYLEPIDNLLDYLDTLKDERDNS